MLTGINLAAYPNKKQKKTISEWFGCGRYIWNAKCEEDKYLINFARRYLPIGTYPKIDQSFSQYKNKELSPWLFEIPSQLLRNSVSNWHHTYRQYLKGLCGKPKRKRKLACDSVHLTRELFSFEKCQDGNTRLFIGTKTKNIGYLSIKKHKEFGKPNSIYLKRKNGKYSISFCYEEKRKEEEEISQDDCLKQLKTFSVKELEEITVGIDRGVVRPVQAGEEFFDYTIEQKRKKRAKEKYIKRCQQKLSRQVKRSKTRYKTKHQLAKAYEKLCNIRNDFCHKTTRFLVDNKKTKIFILETLNTSQMTKKPKPKKDEKTEKYLKNNRRKKAKLNSSILDKCWHKLETYLKYKVVKAKKMWFKVPANYTSQECAEYGHIHPDNRKTQKIFCCLKCGHTDNADHNAARVIKKRALNLFSDSGTELSKQGVLLDKERGAINKTRGAKANRAQSYETLKKKRKAAVKVA